MHQHGLDLAGGQGQVVDGLSVHLQGGRDPGLAVVHPVEGRGVDHHLGTLRLQEPANPIELNQVQRAAGRGEQLVFGQGLHQIDAQLAGSSNQEYLQVSGSPAPGLPFRPRPA